MKDESSISLLSSVTEQTKMLTEALTKSSSDQQLY